MEPGVPDKVLTVAAFAGSLRKGSFNRGLLRAAAESAPARMRVEIMDISDLPLYNADLEAAGVPPSVVRLRETIRKADGLLVVTPEHNYSVPAVTKTVIEWASRPPDKAALDGKPVAVMGAAPGGFGTVRAQTHFRDMAPESNFFVMQ